MSGREVESSWERDGKCLAGGLHVLVVRCGCDTWSGRVLGQARQGSRYFAGQTSF